MGMSDLLPYKLILSLEMFFFLPNNKKKFVWQASRLEKIEHETTENIRTKNAFWIKWTQILITNSYENE